MTNAITYNNVKTYQNFPFGVWPDVGLRQTKTHNNYSVDSTETLPFFHQGLPSVSLQQFSLFL
jgi:hypothetical protein